MVAQVKKVTLILVFTISISACLPVASSRDALRLSDPWVYADLIYLDPVDAISPNLDMVALYQRQVGSDLQIRLDFLDISTEPQADLYLVLDWLPGGANRLPINGHSDLAWEVLLLLPAQGDPRAYAARSPEELDFELLTTFIPRIVRDPLNDTFIVSIPFATLGMPGRQYSIQAFLTAAGSSQPVDSTRPVRSDAPPPRRAPVLFAFWNSFPAYTPAQALRRWRGAHTGPLGGRHGLFALLSSIRVAEVPIVLLDAKTPPSLSALNYVDRLEVLRELAAQGLVTLPDVLLGFTTLPVNLDTFREFIHDPDPYLRAAQDSRIIAQEFNLPASEAVFSPSAVQSLPRSYALAFVTVQGSYPLRYAQHTLVPILPGFEGAQATPDGLELPIRRRLVENALTPAAYTPPIVTLGGDLTTSTWGVLTHALPSMQYIAAHPWIQPLNYYELAAYPAFESQVQNTFSSPADRVLAEQAGLDGLSKPVLDFASAPDNLLSQTAWQGFTSLLDPLPPEVPALSALRAGYLPRLRGLLAAADWAEDPQSVADCSRDFDLDGVAECLLSSQKYFALIDPYGGRLVYLFALVEDGPHQLIAPSTQFIVGLGDPSSWDLSAGENAESAGYHGAFTDSSDTWQMYQTEVSEEGIVLISPDGSRMKILSLTDEGLDVEYRVADALTTSLTLALDPWVRFSQGWDRLYKKDVTPQKVAWGLATGGEVVVTTSASLQFEPFTASLEQMNAPEDPNFDYPMGHYLPFPMAVLQVKARGNFSINIGYNSP